MTPTPPEPSQPGPEALGVSPSPEAPASATAAALDNSFLGDASSRTLNAAVLQNATFSPVSPSQSPSPTPSTTANPLLVGAVNTLSGLGFSATLPEHQSTLLETTKDSWRSAAELWSTDPDTGCVNVQDLMAYVTGLFSPVGASRDLDPAGTGTEIWTTSLLLQQKQLLLGTAASLGKPDASRVSSFKSALSPTVDTLCKGLPTGSTLTYKNVSEWRDSVCHLLFSMAQTMKSHPGAPDIPGVLRGKFVDGKNPSDLLQHLAPLMRLEQDMRREGFLPSTLPAIFCGRHNRSWATSTSSLLAHLHLDEVNHAMATAPAPHPHQKALLDIIICLFFVCSVRYAASRISTPPTLFSLLGVAADGKLPTPQGPVQLPIPALSLETTGPLISLLLTEYHTALSWFPQSAENQRVFLKDALHPLKPEFPGIGDTFWGRDSTSTSTSPIFSPGLLSNLHTLHAATSTDTVKLDTVADLLRWVGDLAHTTAHKYHLMHQAFGPPTSASAQPRSKSACTHCTSTTHGVSNCYAIAPCCTKLDYCPTLRSLHLQAGVTSKAGQKKVPPNSVAAFQLKLDQQLAATPLTGGGGGGGGAAPTGTPSKPTPTPAEAAAKEERARLRTEEQRQRNTCAICNTQGHFKRDCPQGQGGGGRRPAARQAAAQHRTEGRPPLKPCHACKALNKPESAIFHWRQDCPENK